MLLVTIKAQVKNLVRFIQYERNDLLQFGCCGAFLYTGKKAVKEECVFTTKEEINSHNLLKIVENIEQIIETYNRFEAYLVEVQVIQQQGMSFQNWLKSASHEEAQQHEVETICIIPLQPLNL